MPTVKVRNGEIYFEESGSGEPIVLMAGLGHGTAYFEKILPLLAGAGRAVAIDPRGVGRSTSNRDDYSVEGWAQDVADHGLDRSVGVPRRGPRVEDADPVSGGVQAVDDVGPDESGASRDEDDPAHGHAR